MPKTKILEIADFRGGMDSELRGTSNGSFWYSENLDTGQNDRSLTQITSNQTNNPNSYDTNYCICKQIEVGGKIYGLGQFNNSTFHTAIFVKNTTLTDSWALAGGSAIGSSTSSNIDPLFVTDGTYIYFDSGLAGPNYVARYTISNDVLNATWSQSPARLQGGMIGADGNIYGYAGQSLYKVIVTTSVAVAPTIPTTQSIVQMFPYQNFMAITCSSSVEPSKMYIWDYVDTTYFTEKSDIGIGRVSGGCLQDGSIFVAIAFANSRGFRIKTYSGGQFITAYSFTGRYNRAGTYNYALPVSILKSYSGYVYFLVAMCRPDSTKSYLYEYAIVRYGRKDTSHPYSFSVFKTLESATTPALVISTFGHDFLILESLTGGVGYPEKAISAFIYSSTSPQLTTYYVSSYQIFTEAGVMESNVFNGDDSTTPKQLKKISVQFLPLPSAGSVICKYKKDEDTAWTTLFTDAVLNNISHDCVNIESMGAALPQFKEIQFRFEVNGGVSLTGFKLKYDELADLFG